MGDHYTYRRCSIAHGVVDVWADLHHRVGARVLRKAPGVVKAGRCVRLRCTHFGRELFLSSCSFLTCTNPLGRECCGRKARMTTRSVAPLSNRLAWCLFVCGTHTLWSTAICLTHGTHWHTAQIGSQKPSTTPHERTHTHTHSFWRLSLLLAPTTSFRYKNRALDTRRGGFLLGAKYFTFLQNFTIVCLPSLLLLLNTLIPL